MIEPMDDHVNEQSSTPWSPETAYTEGQQVSEPTSVSSELETAVTRFKKAFAERSFSQRHEDLGKMINCRVCGRRHRQADPVALLSRAHGKQAFRDLPSRSVMFAKKRFNPHHNDKVRQFVRLTREIYMNDIAPYFQPDPEHPDNLICRAQRRAARIMRRQWIAERLARKHMQDHSRRINAGLEIPGSRYSHPVRDRKQA